MVYGDPKGMKEVFDDFLRRRTGLIRALTSDVGQFFEQCDPEREDLCLYGLPNGSWKVSSPSEEVPTEFPEPTVGINFERDGMRDKDWQSLVAAHSDSWLIRIASYFGTRSGFNKSERSQLFDKINDLPTIYEVVNGIVEPPTDQSGNSSKRKLSGKTPEPSEEELGLTLCGACGENYGNNEFWIGCDLCDGWFHGKCVKITPAKATHMKQYKCPTCSNKKRAKV